MKKQTLIVVALFALIGLTAASAQAQSSTLVRVSIPFEFKVAEKIMPAGEYLIRQINPSSDAVTLQIAAKDGDANVIVRTTAMQMNGAQRSALAFNRYGSHYFFSMVSIEGAAYSWQAPKSRGERGAARELAALKSAGEVVTVAVR